MNIKKRYIRRFIKKNKKHLNFIIGIIIFFCILGIAGSSEYKYL